MIGNAHDMALSGAVGETMQNMNLKGLSAPVALMTTLMYTYLPHIATAWDDGPWPLCSLCVFSDKSWHYNGQLGTVEWVNSTCITANANHPFKSPWSHESWCEFYVIFQTHDFKSKSTWQCGKCQWVHKSLEKMEGCRDWMDYPSHLSSNPRG